VLDRFSLKDSVPYLLIVALLGAIALACLLAAPLARGDGSPVASPAPVSSPAPTPTPSAAPRQIVVGGAWWQWCLKWQAQARENRRGYAHARWCFGYGPPDAVPSRPTGRRLDRWVAFGQRCKHLAYRFHRRLGVLRERMRNPRPLVSAYSWRPLVLWWFPASQVDYALIIMRRESGGRPTARNLASGCAGLYQLAPLWWRGRYNPYDPDTNVRLAVTIWRSSGWSAWVTAW
jgi:hypothetical protein